ncbi:helix-turn-helix transcriptional regulator [Tissierella praeacuta]|uniref:helix-turn-helix transcriptional regulator n=1 Tax=Tissierella praeacuta TaxID=43131 RepID=UPI001053AD82|nr:helix-turn-helix transcriptional regulator [Tissierella praeacuta]TCU71544.1 putative transcriptional regulator [Tissierella praeacuta]
MRDKLRSLRKTMNISIEQIANKLNISKSFYYKIESGDRNPTIALAKKICKLFDIDIDEIF